MPWPVQQISVKDIELKILLKITVKSTHTGQHPARHALVTAELFAMSDTIQHKEEVLLFDLYKALLELL